MGARHRLQLSEQPAGGGGRGVVNKERTLRVPHFEPDEWMTWVAERGQTANNANNESFIDNSQ